MKRIFCILTHAILVFVFSAEGYTAPGGDATENESNHGQKGKYIIQVHKGGKWQVAGSLQFAKYFKDRKIDLTAFLDYDIEPRVRISQEGGAAAHIDSVVLGERPPDRLFGENDLVLKKVSKKDYDVIDTYKRTVEIIFPTERKDGILTLTARIENGEICEIPFQFPAENLYKEMNEQARFYTYQLNSRTGTINIDGDLDEVSESPPFFKEFSMTGSGHPSSFTYGWVRNDDEYLYAALDFTGDNTQDGSKDYAKLYVKTQAGVKEFKVSMPNRKWGVPGFAYTNKVAYQHKVYELKIPLELLGVRHPDGKENLLLAFAAYGTCAPPCGDPEPEPQIHFDVQFIPGSPYQFHDVNRWGQITGYGAGGCILVNPIDGSWFRDEDTDGVNDLLIEFDSPVNGACFATDINDSGLIVGYAHFPDILGHRAFLWADGVMNNLGTIVEPLSPEYRFDPASSLAYDINNAGKVAGVSSVSWNQLHRGYYEHAAIWSGRWTDIGKELEDLEGCSGEREWPCGTSNVSIAINDSGQVIGQGSSVGVSSGAFLWDGRVTDLGTLGGGERSTIVADINNSGQVVGKSLTENGEFRAFLWEDGTMTELGTLGHDQSEAVAINDKGQIIGHSYDVSYFHHLFLWLPEPAYGLSQGMHDLEEISGGTFSGKWYLSAINNDGVIVGYRVAFGTSYAFLFKPLGYLPPEPPPTGTIKGQLKSALPVETPDGIDVREATVTLYGQKGYVRDQNPGETDEEYQKYLEQSRTAVKSVNITPGDQGQFSFHNVPRIESYSKGGANTWAWAYYSLEITNTQTEEIDLNQPPPVDPTITDTVYFAKETTNNLRPDADEPSAAVEISLNPVDGIGTKQELIDALSAISPNNYLEVENLLQIWFNGLKSNPEEITPEQLEGLKRAIWAERVVRDSANYSDVLLEIMLNGLGTLMADIFDKFADFTRDDITQRKKELEKISQHKNVSNPFFNQQSFDGARYIKNLKLDSVIEDGDYADSIKKVFKAIKPLMEAAAIEFGINEDDAASIANNLQKALNFLMNWIQTRSFAGAAKNEIKKLIEEGIVATQPFLFDNQPLAIGLQTTTDVSYTGMTSDSLQYSIDQFRDWLQADNEQYKQDRQQVVDVLVSLGNEASQIIVLTTYLALTAGALDIAQDLIEVLGKVVKWADAVAKIVEFVKFAENAGTVIAPSLFVYGTAQDMVKAGVYKAYGSQVPTP